MSKSNKISKSDRRRFFVYTVPKLGSALRGSCGKVIYLSPGKARSAIRSLTTSGQYESKPGVFGVYYCDKCEGYHVGHNRFTEGE